AGAGAQWERTMTGRARATSSARAPAAGPPPLTNTARRNRRPKPGGDRQRVALDEALSVAEPGEDLLALDDALGRLAAQEPAKAQLVRLRYFAGLSLAEAAACLGISEATAKRYWTVARAWLYAALPDDQDPA